MIDGEAIEMAGAGPEDLTLEATWEAVRASGDAAHPTELVLRDVDGVEHTFRFARPLPQFPSLAAGTPVHVVFGGARTPPEWGARGHVRVTRGDGSLVLAAMEVLEYCSELPFGLEVQSGTGCHLPHHIFVSGPEPLCYVGWFRYDLAIGGEALVRGEPSPITLDGRPFELTVHRYETQIGERSPDVSPCGPAYRPLLVLEVYPSA